jgi:hypothetical protein
MSKKHNGIPDDYIIGKEQVGILNTPAESAVYRPHLYELLSSIAKISRPSRLIFVGTLSDESIRRLGQEFETIYVGDKPLVDAVQDVKCVQCDLEQGLTSVPSTIWDGAIVVCTDAFERLREPELLARGLAFVRQRCALMLLSTPDRVRTRGVLDSGPPKDPRHAREWGIDEFARFLKYCGFERPFRIGYIKSNLLGRPKSAIIAFAGREAEYAPIESNLRVAAVIHVFNESDIIEATIRHLVREGLEVHIFDNWSDDGSFELCNRLLSEGLVTNLSRFPDRPSTNYEWTKQLQCTEAYAKSLSADWVMHCDADELRLSPWPSVSLLEAIKFVDSLGYSAIDFTVLNFFFTNQSASTVQFDPADFNSFDFGRHSSYLWQIKAWRNREDVNLCNSGGHSAEFPGRRVYPLKFLTKHYPLRSKEQANIKVYCNRIRRMAVEREEKGWHQHYDLLKISASIEPWSSFELCPFAQHIFETEFIVEALTGIGIEPDTVYSINKTTLVQTAVRLAEQLEALTSSRSWRITAPIRRVSSICKRFRFRRARV